MGRFEIKINKMRRFAYEVVGHKTRGARPLTVYLEWISSLHSGSKKDHMSLNTVSKNPFFFT
jgi:hypothetical protein